MLIFYSFLLVNLKHTNSVLYGFQCYDYCNVVILNIEPDQSIGKVGTIAV